VSAEVRALKQPRPVGRPSLAEAEDVRRLLLDAALALIEVEGVEGFSLRECARRAGVSHAAPAHHFVDKAGLLTEFAAEAFDELGRTIERRTLRTTGAPAKRFRETALGYIEFAIGNRSRFQLMFRSDVVDVTSIRLRSAFDACHQRIYGAMAELLVGASGPNERSVAKMTMAWAAIHGFAVLALDGGFGAMFPGKGADHARGGTRAIMDLAAGTVREVEKALKSA
ncbi:MAG: TetR/AcrR family transcriptional regulator, partial [Proteobacteria bacterium]|nr:TetR/AcrR family transcriptional regulator [Pseudomonadota bacterium]